MKSISLIALFLTGASALAAKPQCYKAENPATLQAEIMPEENSSTDSAFEQAVSAQLRLSEDQEGTQLSQLSVKTDAGKALDVGAFRTPDDKAPSNGITTYYVECDGGTINLIETKNDKLALTSTYVRADIEGCDGTARLASAGTVFSPYACKE